ncbi:MAG: response regulator transcription factor [Chitinophagaceae bacterium]
MKKIRVLIADDHKLLRETLSYLIDSADDFEVVAICGDSQEALDAAVAQHPDIILMDINILPFSGIEATQKLKGVAPLSKVIGMSVHSDPVYAKKMMKMGARGYVTKNSPKDEILSAMRRVHNGEVYVCDEIKYILGQQLGADTPASPRLSSLTDREIEIVQFIKEGHSSKEIAVNIGVKVKTVEVHRHNILQKLQLKNAASLVNFMFTNTPYLL